MSERAGLPLPRRLGITLAAVPVLAVGLADGVIAVRTTSAHHATHHQVAAPLPDATSAVQRAAAERTLAIRALLDRRSHAVLHHNLHEFLSTVDPTQHAFVAAQRRLFGNLRAIPFGSWAYDFDANTEQPSTAALSRYDATTWAPQHFVVRYEIRGFDTQPASDQQYPTFVRRPTGWRIASFTDFVSAGATADSEIWDFGPVRVLRTSRVLVLAHPGQTALMHTVASEVSAAIPRVSAVWTRPWSRRVVVLIPTTQHELGKVVGDSGDLSQIAAVASAEVQDCPGPPDPVGNRVAINPHNWPHLSALGRRVVLTHEMTHVATRADTGSCMPTWLVEGFADYVGYLGTGVPTKVVAEELASDVRAGRVPTRLPRDGDFDGGNKRLAQAYEGAWMACRLIASRWGQSTLTQLYAQVGTSTEPPAQAMSQAMHSLLHVSTGQFIAQWRAYLRAQLS